MMWLINLQFYHNPRNLRAANYARGLIGVRVERVVEKHMIIGVPHQLHTLLLRLPQRDATKLVVIGQNRFDKLPPVYCKG